MAPGRGVLGAVWRLRGGVFALAAAAVGAASLGASAGPARAAGLDLGADVGAELRGFLESPAWPDQFDTLQPSMALNADLRFASDDARHQLVFRPFARLDAQDPARTHTDVREGYYRYVGDAFEVQVGAGRVFWGVAESRHLVDVVNQTDLVEDVDEEDKLGQPMVKVSLLRDFGKLDFFWLPLFRERTFPGRDGRLRFEPLVDAALARFGDGAGGGGLRPDFALRYTHFFGPWDVGVSLFSGTSREPLFALGAGADGTPLLAPVYVRIAQLGVDAQYTRDAWLWKFEGIVREGQGGVFAAAVAGFEYTLFGVGGRGADLGLLAEYLYDGRSATRAPVVLQQNDLFFGARYVLNDLQDSSLLAGAVTDLENGSTSVLFEATRRLGRYWRGELEARLLAAVDDDDLVLRVLARDSVVTLRFTRFF